MKARRGFLLLEALLALGLLVLVAGAAFPMIGRVSALMDETDRALRAQEDGLFACDYMVYKIRHGLERTPMAEQKTGDNYAFRALDEDGIPRDYYLMAEEREWKLRLYTGRTQPVTGDGTSSPLYEVRPVGNQPYFTVEPGGLIRISYEMRRSLRPASYTVETAVLPLYDYFLVGEPYE